MLIVTAYRFTFLPASLSIETWAATYEAPLPPPSTSQALGLKRRRPAILR